MKHDWQMLIPPRDDPESTRYNWWRCTRCGKVSQRNKCNGRTPPADGCAGKALKD